MQPSQNDGEEEEVRKPTRPYLRKGDGTARFGMNRRSGPPVTSPAINLPRFTPTNSVPSSARTVDSGILHDDDTRPPTTASLPLDQPSVMENHDSGNRTENDEEHVESVSAMQSFVPSNRTDFVLESCSQVSEEARNFRMETEHMGAQAKFIDSMKSVSITPSSYASSISGPIYQSTPKGSIRHDDQSEDPTFIPPPLVPSQNHSPQTLSSIASAGSLETPQARPLVSNRLNLMVQNDAQTGISLLNNPRRNHVVPARNQQAQKENVPVTQAANSSEHVYDQPIQIQRPQRAPIKRDEQRQKHNLMIQLRDTIAHLDYASECVWSTRKKQEEQYAKRMKELEEDFKTKVESIQEENKSEQDRIQRERRDIERDRKILQKGTGEREKEHTEMIAKLREKLSNSESQNAKLRQEKRAVEEKLKKSIEENEKLAKDLNRNKATCQRLEKHIKQLRTEKERDDKEKEMFAKAAMNRKSTYSVQAAKIPTSSSSSRLPSVTSLTSSMKTGSTGKGRTVSFADEPEEQSLEVFEDPFQPELVMVPYETKKSRFGRSTMYRDSVGETTRMTTTIANGYLFEFSNGDFRWINLQKSVEIYRLAVDRSIIIRLLQFNISFIYTFQRQLEVLRPGDNTTLISVKRRDIRTELHRRENGVYYAEVFDRNGRYVTRDFCHPEIFKDIAPGSACSHRDGGHRYVEYMTPEDFELVEPEFRLRWYKGEVMVCKIFKRPGCNEKTLRLQVNVADGSGLLEEVESQLKNGQSQKSTVFPWS